MPEKKASSQPLLVILSVVLALSLPSSAGRKLAEIPHYGGTLRVKSFSSGPFRPQFDPATSSHVFVIEQLFDGLVRLDASLKVVPSLAEYWVISEDGKKHTFYLRKGVKFHHGKELEAEDVKFSLERLVHKNTAGPYFQYFTAKIVGAQEYWEGKAKEVEGFKVRDRYTFEIHWRSPYVSSLYLLSMNFCKILPRDLVLAQGRGFFEKPSGTGPFKFDYWVRSPRLDIVGVRLVRNMNYFGKRPYLEAIEFSPLYTLDNFLEREIDIIPYISESLSGMDCQVLENDSFITTYLAMSCHLPPLNRPAVRRAVFLGLDKKELAKAAFRLDTIPQVTHNFIPAKLPGFFPVEDEASPDLEKAREILWGEGFGKNPFPPLVVFFEQPRTEQDTKIFRALSSQMERLGIRLNMQHFKSLEEVKSCRRPYLVLLSWMMDFPDPENIILPLFASGSGVNLALMRYSSTQVDELVRRAEVERSWTERIALFQKIEKILHQDVPAVPLFLQQQRLALQPYVRGVKIPPLGFFYLDTREIWLDK